MTGKASETVPPLTRADLLMVSAVGEFALDHSNGFTDTLASRVLLGPGVRSVKPI